MTTNSLNIGSSSATVVNSVVQKQPLWKVSLNKYQQVAAAIILIAGLVLIGSLVGALVFFALTGPSVLFAAMLMALVSGVVLIAMAGYQLAVGVRKDAKERQLVHEKIQYGVEAALLKDNNKLIERKLEELQKHSDALTGQLLGLAGDLECLKQEKIDLEARVMDLQRQNASLSKLMEEGRPDLVAEIENQRKQCKNLQELLLQAEEKNKSLESTVKKCQTELMIVEQQNTLLIERNKELKVQKAALEKMLEDSKQEIKILKEVLADFEAMNIPGNIAELQAKIEEQKLELESLKDQAEKLLLEKDAVMKESQDLKDLLNSSKLEISKNKLDISKLQSELESLQSQPHGDDGADVDVQEGAEGDAGDNDVAGSEEHTNDDAN
uniref:CF0218 n=1 Tax=Chlamydia felis TaxID=83556 RepID=B3Y5T9_9CHLA|nr:CF0218 [Chlamydia felis]